LEKIIEVKNLVKNYGTFNAVNNLNMTVFKGDVYGFLGPNGAGKSTTIRMLLSLISPTSGTIEIFEKNISENRNQILSNIGAIVEKVDLYGYLTAYKNLELLGKMSNTKISKTRIHEVLELVGLLDRSNSKVKTFSQGMKQRLGIAQALLHNPELIILDEPTNGLDPQGIKDIRELINYLAKDQNKTIFLSSHILNEIELIANRMVILNKGKAIVEGDVKELLSADKNLKVTIEFDTAAINDWINQSKWKSNLIKTDASKHIFNLTSEEIPKLVKDACAMNLGIKSLVPIRSLEDYFLNIT
jgi:ABC-2 type transport system ATP-binding protein